MNPCADLSIPTGNSNSDDPSPPPLPARNQPATSYSDPNLNQHRRRHSFGDDQEFSSCSSEDEEDDYEISVYAEDNLDETFQHHHSSRHQQQHHQQQQEDDESEYDTVRDRQWRYEQEPYYDDIFHDEEYIEDHFNSDDEDEGDEGDDDEIGNEEMEEVEELTEITEEVIKAFEAEQEEDDDTDCDDDEALTIDQVQISSHDYDLARELSDDSKCCDLVLQLLPSADHEFEVFNTYGNDLSNAYLLQRYGFVCPGNANDGISLGVPLIKLVKLKRAELKMEWLDDVFELVCELIHQKQHENEPQNEVSGHNDQEHEHSENGCADGCNEGDNCGDGCGDEDDCGDHGFLPDLWQVSARIGADGTVSPHTYVILRLIDLPEKVFKYKLARVQKERVLALRISRLLMNADSNDNSKYDGVIKTWCQQRLAAYPELKLSDHAEVIGELVKGEKAILTRFIGA